MLYALYLTYEGVFFNLIQTKALLIFEKHGIDFNEVQLLWNDPYLILI